MVWVIPTRRIPPFLTPWEAELPPLEQAPRTRAAAVASRMAWYAVRIPVRRAGGALTRMAHSFLPGPQVRLSTLAKYVPGARACRGWIARPARGGAETVGRRSLASTRRPQ